MLEFLTVKYAYFLKFDIKYIIGLQTIYKIFFLAEKYIVNLSKCEGSYET